jgi:hypothetical protein
LLVDEGRFGCGCRCGVRFLMLSGTSSGRIPVGGSGEVCWWWCEGLVDGAALDGEGGESLLAEFVLPCADLDFAVPELGESQGESVFSLGELVFPVGELVSRVVSSRKARRVVSRAWR